MKLYTLIRRGRSPEESEPIFASVDPAVALAAMAVVQGKMLEVADAAATGPELVAD